LQPADRGIATQTAGGTINSLANKSEKVERATFPKGQQRIDAARGIGDEMCEL
jgi:hypothetical protein